MSDETQNGEFENTNTEENSFNTAESTENTAEDRKDGSPLFGGAGDAYFRPFVPFGYTEATYREKKDIARTARGVLIPAIVLFAVSKLWSIAYFYIMAIFGFSLQQATLIVSEPLVLQAVSAVVSCLMFLPTFSISAKVMKYRISDLIPFEKPKKDTILPYFCFGLAFFVLSNFVTSYAGNIFESWGIRYNLSSNAFPKGVFGVIVTVISVAVVPPLVEEFACRGVVFGMLRKYGEGFAILVSAAIFGIIHGNFEQMPFAFLGGLAFGIIRSKTNSLWICCAVHAGNNLISVVFEYLDLGVVEDLLGCVLFVAIIVVGIFALCRCDEKFDAFSLEKPSHECTVSQKYKWFMLTPAFIIFVAVFLYDAISYLF